MNTQYCYGCMEELTPGQMICPHCKWNQSYRHNDEIFLAEGTILNEKYLLGRVLGKGGFGITYLGMDLTLQVKVAIKEYFPNAISSRTANSSFVKVPTQYEVINNYQKGLQAFQTEAQTLAKFNSPYIVHVREFFLANNTAYIVMDYIDGNGFGDEINFIGGRMPWQRVVKLMLPLMPELDQLHKKNLIHRDIKPENLKIVKNKNTGEESLVLLDFGAARGFAMGTLTYSQVLTPGYAPYEQYLERGHQGPYTDIYALCATMYKAITGEKPPSAPDRMMDHNEILRSFKSYGLRVPSSIEKIIFQGLQNNIESRPQSMNNFHSEFVKELSRIPENEWETIQPIVQPVRQKKNLRKFFITAASLISILSFLFIIKWINQLNLPQNKYEINISETNNFLQEQEILAIIEKTSKAEKEFVSATKTAEIEKTMEMLNMEETSIANKHSVIGTPIPPFSPSIEVKLPTSYRYGQTFSFGHYEQDNNLNNGAEGIEWQVLDINRDKILVISKYGIDSKQYNKEEKITTWENCSLRAWLNNEFYNTAFNSLEKTHISEVYNNNPSNSEYDISGGNATMDKMFLLSMEEVEKYLPTPNEKICVPTNYARQNSAWTDPSGNSWWWLRSPGFSTFHAAFIDSKGYIEPMGWSVDYENGAIRPAFWLIP